MKQKMVVKVQMNCQKCRTKAFVIAASAYGVDEVKIEGEDKDRVVVIGEGVDFVGLVNSFRKQVGHAHILSLDEVKPKTKQQKSNPEHHGPHSVRYDVIYHDQAPGYCCLM